MKLLYVLPKQLIYKDVVVSNFSPLMELTPHMVPQPCMHFQSQATLQPNLLAWLWGCKLSPGTVIPQQI